jgi:cytochrome c biogenesis protein CcmG/thiol:disulfide interchange protein DsbE
MTLPVPDPPAVVLPPRRPRKVFLLVGLVVAAVLGIGLFTSAGTKKTSGPPHVGAAVPSFSASRVKGSGTVQVAGAGDGSPTVILFFGKWCPSCHTELPPLAAAVRSQVSAGGALSHVRVIGVDSEDTLSNAKSFVRSSGVTFPVAYDPNIAITSGAFYFEGDPHAVFVNGDGTISRIMGGVMSPATFTAEEKKLIPSGS